MSVPFMTEQVRDRDSLKITNPRIVSFYQSNNHIDLETMNLLLIEILSNAQTKNVVSVIDQIQSAILYPNEQKISELDTFIGNMRDIIRKLIQSISGKFVAIKSEYIREFKSASIEHDARELLCKINNALFESICSLMSPIVRTRFSSVSDKVKLILQQFNKILNANTEHIFSSVSKVDEYLQNFESNSAHMVQAVIQLLTDFLSSYETRAKTVTELIRKNEDPAFTVYYKLIYELNDVLHQLPSLTEDLNQVESFEHLLSKTFTTASVSREPDSNEYMLIREDKPAVYIETHEMRDKNVGTTEIKQFLKRSMEQNTHGVLISQYTGITSKPNYHIEIHNNIVVIYLHKLSYSSENIQIAIDMIDSIASKLNDFCALTENKYSIPKDILDSINREYQQFILQKEAIVTGFKEHQKRLISQLEDIKFSTLDKYLSTRYSSCKKQGYSCDLCNNFNVGTLKGLAAHKRGCARKLVPSQSSYVAVDEPVKKTPVVDMPTAVATVIA